MTVEEPFISVIIPVYNDPEGIEATLESVTDQTYPDDRYEVLVVDNGSEDETPQVIQEFRRRHPETVHPLVENDVRGSYAARNEGIRNASGALLAFVDADMTVDETWIESIAASFADRGWDYMGCNVEMYIPEGEETYVAKYNRLQSLRAGMWLREYHFAPTCCLVVRKEVFDHVGLFDSRLISAGDSEFGQRVHDAGFDQHFAPDVTMYHPARTSLRETISRYVRIGKGNAQMETFHPYYRRPSFRSTLISYLPPSPFGFYDRFDERAEETGHGCSFRDIVAFYLIEYVTKLATAIGRAYGYRSDLVTPDSSAVGSET